MVQNPHRCRCGERRRDWTAWLRCPWAAGGRQLETWAVLRGRNTRHQGPLRAAAGTKFALLELRGATSGTKLALLARNGPFWRVLCVLGDFCPVWTLMETSRVNFVPPVGQGWSCGERKTAPA